MGRLDAILSLAAIAIFIFVFWVSGKLSTHYADHDDEVQLIEETPPPPPKPLNLPPPKVTPPPPKVPEPQPVPQNTPPPPPQFGLEKEATTGNGDMAVATGNSLAVKADTVVKPPPPAPPLQIDREPEALEKVLPLYPEWAEEQGVGAKVLVFATIDETGLVVAATIRQSGGKDFDHNALAAEKATKYKPYLEGGKPRPASFVKEYDFVPPE